MIPKRDRITCQQRVDWLKGNWYLWEADLVTAEGETIHGFVQADRQGESADPITFEPEDE